MKIAQGAGLEKRAGGTTQLEGRAGAGRAAEDWGWMCGTEQGRVMAPVWCGR